MQLPVIKNIIEKYSIEELKAAEESLMEGENLAIEIEGKDEGEQLTHILAAIWIKEDMAKNGTEMRLSLRNYTQRVRNSIS